MSRDGLLPTVLLPLLVALVMLAGCERAEPVFNSRFPALGAMIDLSLVGIPKSQAQAATSAIEADFRQLRSVRDGWNPGPLGRVNELCRTGKRFAAPPSVLPMLELSRQLSDQSGGLFNPAIGELVAAWSAPFPTGRETMTAPSPERIATLVRHNPRMSDIEVNGIYLRCRNTAIQLDFGGFDKGFGIDQAVRHLRELGIHNAVVRSGDDLRAIGSRSGAPWRIAIRRPTGGGVLGTIDVSGDESVFTAASHEPSDEVEVQQVNRIIDPRTGNPATGTASVTVLHTEAAIADAAATALFVAGPDHWYEVAKAMGIGFVVLVDDSGVLHLNPEMQARLQLLDDRQEIRLSPPLTVSGGQS